jgi:hypothetical protein
MYKFLLVCLVMFICSCAANVKYRLVPVSEDPELFTLAVESDNHSGIDGYRKEAVKRIITFCDPYIPVILYGLENPKPRVDLVLLFTCITPPKDN